MTSGRMIARSEERAQFARIDNQTLQDESLPWAARGLLAYLLSLPPDWTVYTSELATRSPGGRRQVETALRHLTAAGYVKMRQTRIDKRGRRMPISAEQGKFAPAIQCVHERPVTTCEHDSLLRETYNGSDGRPEEPSHETYNGEETPPELGPSDIPAGQQHCTKRAARNAHLVTTQQETTLKTRQGVQKETMDQIRHDVEAGLTIAFARWAVSQGQAGFDIEELVPLEDQMKAKYRSKYAYLIEQATDGTLQTSDLPNAIADVIQARPERTKAS